jgi:hypothetical protein
MITMCTPNLTQMTDESLKTLKDLTLKNNNCEFHDNLHILTEEDLA